jgi:high-affinity nickel permease
VDPSPVATLGLGFLLGVRHALDADHVAAVSTFVSQDRSIWRACLRGTFWGLGHTAALLAAGVAVVAFKWQIPPALEEALEATVALVLIGLGGHVLVRALATARVHRHPHSHEGSLTHTHLHVHLGEVTEPGHRHLWRAAPRPLLMGLLHGLAGSGALVLLALAGLPSPAAVLVYILVFGAGSTAGMLVLSGVIGVPFALAASGSQGLALGLRVIVGVASIAVGLLMARGLLV